ncbi:MAG: ABC transporter permease [Desulfosarcinaceae bacterium]
MQSAKTFLPWILPAITLLAWYLASETKLVPNYLLPHPLKILAAAHTYVLGPLGSEPYAGRFLDDAVASLIRVFSGFALAVVFGLPLGVLSGRLAAVQQLLDTSLNAVRAVPGICWLPLALVWFGIGMGTTIFLVSLAAFFPVYLNAADGARQVNALLCRSGAMMGVGLFRVEFAILLPASMPQITTGLRLGLGIAWAYLVLGELTGVPNGLGAVIMDARMLGRIDIILVGIIIIAILGRLSDLCLKNGLRLFFKSARRLA